EITTLSKSTNTTHEQIRPPRRLSFCHGLDLLDGRTDAPGPQHPTANGRPAPRQASQIGRKLTRLVGYCFPDDLLLGIKPDDVALHFASVLTEEEYRQVATFL